MDAGAAAAAAEGQSPLSPSETLLRSGGTGAAGKNHARERTTRITTQPKHTLMNAPRFKVYTGNQIFTEKKTDLTLYSLI